MPELTYHILKQRDPSRTTVLRNAFSKALRKRFRVLRGIIWKTIVGDNVFARRFAFSNSSDKVAAFVQWLHQQIDNEILQVTRTDQVGQGVDRSWINKYIQDGYRTGVARARAQMRRMKVPSPIMSSIFSDVRHIDRVGLLYTRTFADLKGITDEMVKLITRTLTEGLANGLKERIIARQINLIISGTTLRNDILINAKPGSAEYKADLLARTEIIRAHAEGQLQEFENWGLEGVSVQAEFLTAGDARVCQICQRYEKSIFTIQEARGLIPLHARCRCIWLPFIKEPKKRK